MPTASLILTPIETGSLAGAEAAARYARLMRIADCKTLNGLHELPVFVQQHSGYVRLEIVTTALPEQIIEL